MAQLQQVYPVDDRSAECRLDFAAAAEATLARWRGDNIEVDTAEESDRRRKLVFQLTYIFLEWVRETCLGKGWSEEEAAQAGGLLHTSGSFKLAIDEPGADIDVICVAPSSVTIEDFFTSLKVRLLADRRVENLNAIETARVPIITFDFDSVNIDLQLATLPLRRVAPTLDITDDSVLRGCTESSKDVLGGPRATIMIAKLVPGFDGGSNFRHLVRILRKWCKSRGIYSNKVGYIGGININILSALVCQMYPHATTSTLVRKFFFLFHRWNWQNPVLLCRPVEHEDMQWQNWASERDLMPIITPNYPTINSTYNVNKWTLKVMREEFIRGRKVVEEAARRSDEVARQAADLSEEDLEVAQAGVQKLWDELVAPSDFLAIFERYLILNVRASTVDNFNSWKGYIESRLRVLVHHHRAPCLGQLPFSAIRIWPKELEFRVEKTKPGAPADTVVLYEVPPAAEGEEPTPQPDPSEADPEKRVCGCYVIGINTDPRRKRKHISLDGVFESWRKTLGVDVVGAPLAWVTEDMGIDFDIYTFGELPDAALDAKVDGRENALKLRRAHKRRRHEENLAAQKLKEEKKKLEAAELEKERAAAALAGALEEALLDGDDEEDAKLKRERAEDDADADADAAAAKRVRGSGGGGATTDGASLEMSLREIAADGSVLAHPFRDALPSSLAFYPKLGTPAAMLLEPSAAQNGGSGLGSALGVGAAHGFGVGGWVMTPAAQQAFERALEGADADANGDAEDEDSFAEPSGDATEAEMAAREEAVARKRTAEHCKTVLSLGRRYAKSKPLDPNPNLTLPYPRLI
uniref:polynucleotide adenylyltransferase n=1 Tax=Phaeomonas parva TaxID=124430 RepID=A0A7S1XP67_9STRA